MVPGPHEADDGVMTNDTSRTDETTPGPAPGDGGPRGTRDDLQAELRHLWRTRPVRTREDGMVAGVCSGMGRRYGVDPVLLRVVFVVTALSGGAGVLVYILGWLTFRLRGDEVSLVESLFGRGRSTESKGLGAALLVVALLAAPTAEGAGITLLIGSGTLLTIGLLLGWYGLHRRMPQPPAGWQHWSDLPAVRRTGAPPSPGGDGGPPVRPRYPDWPGSTAPGHGATGHGATGYDGTGYDATRQPFDTPRRSDPLPTGAPPAWDPLGAAPFAWHLPDPDREHRTPRPATRSRLTGSTLGLAVIALAVSIALAHFGHVGWLTPSRILAIPLVVVCAGMLIGALTRRGYGLLVVAGPLAGLVVLASVGDGVVERFRDGEPTVGGDVSDRRVVVTDPAQIAPISSSMGDLVVDLRPLVLDRDRDLDLDTALGDVIVTLPTDLDVRVTCTSGLGDIDCPTGLDVGGDGRSGPVLTIDASSDLGQVRVTR